MIYFDLNFIEIWEKEIKGMDITELLGLILIFIEYPFLIFIPGIYIYHSLTFI
jgi:hypothetical protein